MSGRAQRILMAIIVLLGSRIPVFSQAYPTAAVTISTTGNPLVSGTMTIAFNGHTHTVPYGQFSTPSSIASGFAAEFSSYPASAWPSLCTIGVCARANGPTITFQLYGGASFGPITITSNPTTGTSPFGGLATTPSNISLISSANPSTFEAPVTFTSTLPNGASGNVTFFDGTNSPGSGTITGTTANYTSSALAVGTHSVTAIYLGDGNYSGSVSGLTQVVTQATPTVTLATSGTPTTIGAPITFTASISSLPTSAPTGTVTFKDGSVVIGTGQVSATTATMTTGTLAIGTHTITANYAGDTNFAASTSSALTQVVGAVVVPGGIITTVAGNGIAGYSGNHGAATSAELSSPAGVAVDANGNIYFADAAYGYIREVNAGTGIITTVAGTGAGGYSGSGPATSTSVGIPAGVSVDASGNIYIADVFDSRVLKVTLATGVLSSIAGTGTDGYSGDGGPATSAYLGEPVGLSIDAGGNLYIACLGDSRIRKINPAGIITTAAGNGTYGYSGDGGSATSAELNSPLGVYADATGDIYIADTDNNRIRKVSPTGIITTVVGTGIAGYSGDGGAATSAHLNGPQAVYGDANGNIYLADGLNNRIREVNAGGIITTVAGNGTAGYSGDGGIATSAELNLVGFSWGSVAVNTGGTLYISDSKNNRIRAVGPSNNPLAISVATSGSPSAYGSPVTFTAAVPGGDTNTVTFYSGGNPIGTATPSNGTAVLTISSLAAGVNAITASIAAGGTYPSATSNVIDQMVNQLTSTISISNIPTNAGYGGGFTATYNYSGNGSPSVSSITPSVCTASYSSVSYVSAGTCTLQASVPATADYAAATGNAQSFTVSPPTIVSLYPSSGPESTPVMISGLGFGLSPNKTTVAFNGILANISSWSNTSIVAEVPTGATTGNVVVTANSITSNGVSFTVQATTPTIVSLSATSGNAGLAVTIIGSGFGVTEGQSTVKFNGTTAGLLNWSDSSITAIVPSGATTGSVVVRLTNGQMSNTNITFTVASSPSCSVL